MSERKVRLIAFYLPQYHPIPENDQWWGKGFTEWTNVTKARALFHGHYQPRIPADLGYYDLRDPEVRADQAEMAREHGIEGFCYWHYWFAGKRLLEQPFNEVLRSGEPNFPFCLAWANQTWTGIWHGAPNRILIEQTYPGIEDYESHFYAVLDAFNDDRYITIEGKPVFVVYRPHQLPDPKMFTDCWRKLAIQSGLKGIYFILERICKKLAGIGLKQLYERVFSKPTVYDYKDVIKHADPPLEKDFYQYPCVIPNWDNTPRSGVRGVILHDSTPELFRIHLKEAISQIHDRPKDKRVVFIKSWNEWAEGNYLEPDQKFGQAYLEVIKQEMSRHLVEITPANPGKS
jgi:lipopolysaccharide biosynthesis protein